MSIEVLKRELAGLAETERTQILAYFLSLQDGQDEAYRTALARKIEENDPRRWVTLEELDRRLSDVAG
jgi:hypothetical protein